MKLEESFEGITRLFLDTSPVIYYVEEHPQYFAKVEIVFDRIKNSEIIAVASPVTIAECLVVPYRLAQTELQQEYTDLILNNNRIFLAQINGEIALLASQLRAKYNLKLPDAFQVAVALEAGCEALLTNNGVFRRVTEIRAIALDDLEL
ncbi:MAG: PIN domain-containing protein [Cyanobacteriota bacterium]|nr:PIN domain-containing protein [Cyanobacteriota bacterium]